MRNAIIAAFLVAELAACGTAPTPAATSVQTVASDALAADTLYCNTGTALTAIPGVHVAGASASSVALACATSQIAGAVSTAVKAPVPAPGPTTPTTVPVATVAAAIAAAVRASAAAAP